MVCAPPTTVIIMVQEREAEAKHHEMEAARREAAEKAREYEGVRAEVYMSDACACLDGSLPGCPSLRALQVPCCSHCTKVACL